jgi:competence protein ComEC
MILNKKNIYVGILVVTTFLLVFFIWPIYKRASYLPQLIFLDIGQGDASLIKLPTREIILVDGGPDNLLLRRLGEELPFYQKKIDYIFISHWHDDHIVGVMQILSRFQVGALIYAEGLTISPLGQLILEEARSKNIPIVALKSHATLSFNDKCGLEVFNPLIFEVKSNDNDSLLLKLKCNDKEFLLLGDNEKSIEEALLESGFDLSADIFKASHHGSKTSNQRKFLEAVNPKVLLISAGLNNKFGHPAPETIVNALEMGINIWRTDLQGPARFNLE